MNQIRIIPVVIDDNQIRFITPNGHLAAWTALVERGQSVADAAKSLLESVGLVCDCAEVRLLSLPRSCSQMPWASSQSVMALVDDPQGLPGISRDQLSALVAKDAADRYTVYEMLTAEQVSMQMRRVAQLQES